MEKKTKGGRQVRIAVVGGGASGLFAAGKAAERGCEVTLFEKNDRPGRKLGITGKGRCNVTNDCDVTEFLKNVPTNPRFLYSALSRFSPAETKAFFEERGVRLKTERGGRVFPLSDKAGDIVDALTGFCREKGVHFRFEKVLSVLPEDGTFRVETSRGKTGFDRVLIATGGLSYPKTGSDGDGLRMAKEMGIDLVPCSPSLVPMVSPDPLCAAMQGLSLKNVELTVENGGKTVYTDFGEMLFTHFGISGPMVLSASSHVRKIGKDCRAHIDLKPALDEKTLDRRLLSDFSKYANRDFRNALCDLLPAKMIPVIVEKSRIDPLKKVNEISREERSRLLKTVKDLSFPISGFRPISEAIVTSGGVSTSEIDPKTMECKKIKGLYFAGEVLDVDAHTGGFNLQIAFSTAFAAASAMSGENIPE